MCNTCGVNITPGNRPLVMAEKPKNGVTTVLCCKICCRKIIIKPSISLPSLMPIKVLVII